VAGALVAGVSAEAFLRLTNFHRQFAQRDATIGYVLTPHFTRTVPVREHPDHAVIFRTNNLGLRRDDDTVEAKPRGTRRVLIVGDSQSEGIVNNDESYSAGLERALNTRGGGTRRVEVLNGAVSGYSPLLEYLWLRERGRRLQPDIIVLALYVGNDIAELQMHHEDFGGFGPRFKIPFLDRVDGDWQISLPGADGGAPGRFDWLMETHLRVYALLRRTLSPPPSSGDASLLRVVGQCPGCLQSMWQAFVAHADLSGLAAPFSKLDHLLRLLQNECRDLHAAVLAVIIPSKVEVEGRAVAADVQHAMDLLGLRYDAAAFDSEIRRRMIAAAARQGIPVVDLFPALQAAATQRTGPLYWMMDWHLNVEGHRVVTEQLAPVIATLLDGLGQ